ncbi:AAA family ATPase [Microcoleus sp. herbarium7]|uniref:AAA family ATPase n=1 Tax=Microcoleus sp. herbarium7 TaxID=3055435 RepID=UPI002FD491B1
MKYPIPLKQITLIGGLLDVTRPSVIEAIAQEIQKTKPNASVIQPAAQKNKLWFSEQYELIEDAGFVELIFLPFLKLADESILGVIHRNDTIRIHREDQPHEELHSARHVLQRLAMMVFSLVNERVLLIDQVENGLYYTAYEDLWIMLFEFASFLEAQVLATTHSLEMIEVFVKNAEEFKPDGNYGASYVEIATKARTGEPIPIDRDPDVLLYALERDKEVRGD